jgi:hypothetical protein
VQSRRKGVKFGFWFLVYGFQLWCLVLLRNLWIIKNHFLEHWGFRLITHYSNTQDAEPRAEERFDEFHPHSATWRVCRASNIVRASGLSFVLTLAVEWFDGLSTLFDDYAFTRQLIESESAPQWLK